MRIYASGWRQDKENIMRAIILAALGGLCVSSIVHGEARVLITEIMYNPASNERRGETEWVEIANVGDEAVEIKDWKLDDEDRGQWGAFSTTLKPGDVAVLVNKAHLTEETFRAAWDVPPDAQPDATAGFTRVVEDADTAADDDDAAETPPIAIPAYQVIPVEWCGISNRPTEENEILKLLDAADNVVCEVNIQASGDWPKCSSPDGRSIWLKDLSATDLNQGTLWLAAEAGTHGCRASVITEQFDAVECGSPGYVEGLTSHGVAPAPASTESEAKKSGDPPAESPPDAVEEDDDDTIDY
jgi:hypothetical protein